MSKFVICQKNRNYTNGPGYSGSLCLTADVPEGEVYEDFNKAQKDADKLDKYNVIGFHVVEYIEPPKMEMFEIHITGDKGLIDVCHRNNLKAIEVELLDKKHQVLRKEFMTSISAKCPDLKACAEYTSAIKSLIESDGVEVVRTKIECPYYEHYVDSALYIESHMPDRAVKGWPINSPISHNANKPEHDRMATDRCYLRDRFKTFREIYKREIVELCVYDDNHKEDADWFDAWSFDAHEEWASFPKDGE